MLQHNHGTRFGSIVFTASTFLVVALVVAPNAVSARAANATAVAAQQDGAILRYARAGENGAKIYNLADKTSIAIGAVPAKGLLEVYGEKAGYLSVAAPGGMDVWVFGQYLRTTPVPGIVEVTGDGVFMRPIPKSDPSSYPLQQQLHKGDRLRVIGRNDATKALNEDWIRVVTPPGTRAWVLASDTVAVDAKEDVSKAWGEAVRASLEARPKFDLTPAAAKTDATDATAKAAKADGAQPEAGAMKADAAKTDAAKGDAKPAAAPRSEDSFDAAQKMYDAAAKDPNANWAPVRAAFERYVEKNPSGAFAEQARLQLQRIGLHEEIARIRNDQVMRESQRAEALKAAQQRLAEANASKDPLGGKFQARGWIVREQVTPTETPRYVVYWAGTAQAEIVCSSGRYDLANFDQFEVGIVGAVLRPAVAATATTSARPARIDVTRVEVLGGRSSGK